MLFPIMVTCPQGLENLLEQELVSLGLDELKNHPSLVTTQVSLEQIYQIALWSRLANRLLLILGQGSAKNSDTLYQSAKEIAWSQVFSPDLTFKVVFHGNSPELRNEMYAALVIKDAIVDYFREQTGTRPNVEQGQADVVIHAYLKHQEVKFCLDLVGFSLHQRSYRLEQGQAPLKENVAAALLYRMNWPEYYKQGLMFADFMCGSATIVIEAALMAANIAPGLMREDQHFAAWLGHEPELWQSLRAKAKALQVIPQSQFYASDIDAKSIQIATNNAIRAGVSDWIEFKHLPLNQVTKLADKGLVVINPPYGERLGEQQELMDLYQAIGHCLYHHFQAWTAGVITSDPMLAKAIGLRSHKQYRIYNGPLDCQLYCFHMEASNQLKTGQAGVIEGPALMLANRLHKNVKHLRKWAARQGLECYRLYDADLPEYAFAIDQYRDFYVIQEYMPPKEIPAHVAENRRLDMLRVAAQVLETSARHLIFKERKPQKEEQYQKLDERATKMQVQEGGAKFYVNLYDYLDTGLFLDHRLLRLEFAKLPPGTRFLNLFCYTATASVHAGLAGATTVNVDLSKTYLTWATENFKLNQLSTRQHRFVQADVMAWLKINQEKFDIIFMDTPSFSNSKRMQGTLDIQRDHYDMIEQALKHLVPGGRLYFSTHLRGFRLDPRLERVGVKNISAKTLDLDFKRDAKTHYCYEIEPV